MRCNKCGNSLPDYAMFCNVCGSKTGDMATTVSEKREVRHDISDVSTSFSDTEMKSVKKRNVPYGMSAPKTDDLISGNTGKFPARINPDSFEMDTIGGIPDKIGYTKQDEHLSLTNKDVMDELDAKGNHHNKSFVSECSVSDAAENVITNSVATLDAPVYEESMYEEPTATEEDEDYIPAKWRRVTGLVFRVITIALLKVR